MDTRIEVANRATVHSHFMRSFESGEARSDTAHRAGGRGNFNDRVGQRPHGADKNLNDGSVKLRIRASLQFRERIWRTPGFLVRAVAGNRIEGIGDRDDASPQWNIFSGQRLRIARAVEEFVVVQDQFADARERLPWIGELRAKLHV